MRTTIRVSGSLRAAFTTVNPLISMNPARRTSAISTGKVHYPGEPLPLNTLSATPAAMLREVLAQSEPDRFFVVYKKYPVHT